MAKNSITDYSKTAASNTDIQSVDIAEGCLPSGINNAIRELMADLADMNDGTVSLTSPAFTSVDINGGTIDGTVIGGTTAAAGTFTSATVGSTASSAAVHSYTKLEVESSSHTALQLSGSTGGEQWIWFADDSSSTPVGGITYYHGGPYMAFRVEGSERLRIDSSGNVGIGTSSPLGKLEVKGAGFVASHISGDSTSETQLRFNTNTAARVSNQANTSLIFDTNATERMRIDSSGRVGIGTSSPTQKLTVANGYGIFEGIKVGQNGTDIDSTFLGASSLLAFKLNGTERMRIDSSGNVGIGDTAPVTPLTIATTNKLGSTFTGTTNGEGLTVTQTNYTAGNYISLVEAAYDDSGDIAPNVRIGAMFDGNGSNLAFGTSNSYGSGITNTAMFIDSSGNVGLGTSTFNATYNPKLQVTSDQSDGTGGVLIQNYLPTLTLEDISGGAATSQIQQDQTSMLFKNGGTERLRIDSSGNVGIGTSSPSQKLDVRGAGARIYLNDANEDIDMNSTADGQLRLDGSGYAGAIALNTDGMNIYTNASSRGIIFGVNETERMRIDTSGNVLVGATNNAIGNVGFKFNSTGFARSERSGTAAQGHIAFTNANGDRGSITTNSTSTQYNTTSDYRLKENVTGITDGIERVKQLNPSRFNFIVDADTTVDGFMAHEAATVVPEAVTGEKDAVDADGNPEYQGIDQSKLVPLLTAALQEAITKIEDLESRVATLEGN